MKLIRSITPEIRIVSASTGEVDYIASDSTLDSYREILLARGWRFDLFAKNAPLVDSHDYYDTASLLGRVVSFEVKSGKLVNRARFALDVPSNVKARLAFEMVAAGYLRAVSVGFRPDKFVTPQTPDLWAKTVAAAGLDAETAAKCRCIFTEMQQLELSVVILGANPNALVRAYDGGLIKDGDFRHLGLRSDEDVCFLLRAGRAFAAASEAEQLLLSAEISRRVSVQRAQEGHGPHSAPSRGAHDCPAASSGSPASGASAGGAPEAKRQAEQLLRELQRRSLMERLTSL